MYLKYILLLSVFMNSCYLKQTNMNEEKINRLKVFRDAIIMKNEEKIVNYFSFPILDKNILQMFSIYHNFEINKDSLQKDEFADIVYYIFDERFVKTFDLIDFQKLTNENYSEYIEVNSQSYFNRCITKYNIEIIDEIISVSILTYTDLIEISEEVFCNESSIIYYFKYKDDKLDFCGIEIAG